MQHKNFFMVANSIFERNLKPWTAFGEHFGRRNRAAVLGDFRGSKIKQEKEPGSQTTSNSAHSRRKLRRHKGFPHLGWFPEVVSLGIQGEMDKYAGYLFYGECGKRLYLHRGKNIKPENNSFQCVGFQRRTSD